MVEGGSIHVQSNSAYDLHIKKQNEEMKIKNQIEIDHHKKKI